MKIWPVLNGWALKAEGAYRLKNPEDVRNIEGPITNGAGHMNSNGEIPI